MKILPELQTRPHPETIPMIEVILPLPEVFARSLQCPPGNFQRLLAVAITGTADHGSPRRSLRPDFLTMYWTTWRPDLSRLAFPDSSCTRYWLPMREDVYDCIKEAAAALNVTAHELLLGILAEHAPNEILRPAVAKAGECGNGTRSAVIVAGPWKSAAIVAGPWKKTRKRADVQLALRLTPNEASMIKTHLTAFHEGCSGPGFERYKENWPALCLDNWFGSRMPDKSGFPSGVRLPPPYTSKGRGIHRIYISIPAATFAVYQRLLHERYVFEDGFTMTDLAKLALLTFSDRSKRVSEAAVNR